MCVCVCLLLLVSGMFREGQSFVRAAPRHILRGHEEPIIRVAVESELDVCVSISQKGQVILHSLTNAQILLYIYVPRVEEVDIHVSPIRKKSMSSKTSSTNSETLSKLHKSFFFDSLPGESDVLHLSRLVEFSNEGHMIFYSHLYHLDSETISHPQLAVCDINARYVQD